MINSMLRAEAAAFSPKIPGAVPAITLTSPPAFVLVLPSSADTPVASASALITSTASPMAPEQTKAHSDDSRSTDSWTRSPILRPHSDPIHLSTIREAWEWSTTTPKNHSLGPGFSNVPQPPAGLQYPPPEEPFGPASFFIYPSSSSDTSVAGSPVSHSDPVKQEHPAAETPDIAISEGRRVYIGNLKFCATRAQVKKLLKDNGVNNATERIYMPPKDDQGNRGNKGFAFVTYSDAAAAQAAIVRISGVFHLGRRLVCRAGLPKGVSYPHGSGKRWLGKKGKNRALSESDEAMYHAPSWFWAQNPDGSYGYFQYYEATDPSGYYYYDTAPVPYASPVYAMPPTQGHAQHHACHSSFDSGFDSAGPSTRGGSVGWSGGYRQ
ncbi:hypothetical protein BJ170DRAFT_677348 [Xylariales sp. AK1849]|nr:hypothetical protein BJ170DRAFT_677348 [Xylariales sp. AK1849]